MSSFVQEYFPQPTASPGKPDFPVKYALHLNEMPQSVPDDLRQEIARRVERISFNKYPEPFGQSLIAPLAQWYHCDPNQIMVAPGSSAFIRLLLAYFGLNRRGKILITRPSFTYYEQYCQAFRIPFEPWELDENFDYVPSALDSLPDYSVVFLTTPNNPTGNVIPLDDMRNVLTRHRKSLFVVDEAYAEFVEQTMLPLLQEHDNLVLLRTFSKGFCAAGVRCGVLFAQESIVQALMNLQTPWQLTPFTIEATKVILEYTENNPWFQEQVNAVVKERERLYQMLNRLNSRVFTVFPSQANFLLIKSKDKEAHQALLASCATLGVLIKDLSNEPRLENYVRVTVGTADANNQFYQALKDANKEQS